MATALNGSSQPVSLGLGYALRTPGWRGSADLHTGGAATTRSAMRGLDDGMNALERALRETRVDEVRQVELVLQPSPAPGGGTARAATTSSEIELEVPHAGDDYGQLVLSIDDAGALRWHLPEADPPDPRLSTTRGAGRVKRFRIPADTEQPPEPPGGAGTQRSVFGVVGRRLLKVLVYPLTDPIVGAVTEAFARQWESQKRPYRLRKFTPADYQGADATLPSAEELAALAAAGPVLLFIHGTFSTAHGGFGDLPPETMVRLHERYGGRVLAFDHPTLGVDPRANADWLVQRLPPGGIELDIVSHSRGGLVARVLAETQCSSGSTPAVAKVRRVVFVAAPNNGTLLADPDHIVNMIDRLTTLLALFPTGPVTEMLEALITAVKVIGHGGLKGLDGLASMRPDGRFLGTLNGPGSSAGDYFAIAANYSPTDKGLRGLVAQGADLAVDRVFGNAANDLVVPTDGVFQKNGNARFPLADSQRLVFAPADGVMHTTLFRHPRVSERLLAWLG